MGKREQINKRLPYQKEERKHVFVCTMNIDDTTRRLDYVMRRHHVYLDYQNLSVSPKEAMKHNMEYADLMQKITWEYRYDLIKKGYDESRGDSTGVIISSSRQPYLVYSVGIFEGKDYSSTYMCYAPALFNQLAQLAESKNSKKRTRTHTQGAKR
jgi:hypothetical protein